MPFDPASFSAMFQYLVGFSAAFFAALWLSLVVWTYKDIRVRSREPFARILAILVVAVLFLPGVVIYLILRPFHTLEEEYQRTLEEEALLKAIEEINTCPGCGRHTREEWVVCPTCHTRLKKICPTCKKNLELPWNICPYCATASIDGQTSSSTEFDQSVQV
jgi:hypothetical protein